MNDEKKVVELVVSNPEVKQQKSEIIIVAPHCDDEIIGMYSILVDKSISPVIIYTEDTPNERRQEALKLKTFLSNIKVQLFAHHVPEAFLNPNSILYFPDHIHEFHPDHRKIGYRGEELFRRGLDVRFYSVQMNVAWIQEVKNWKDKKRLLDKVYPSQKGLWSSDLKYVLFEARYKWEK